MKLLLVEDEQRMGQALSELLRQENYEVDWYTDGQEGADCGAFRLAGYGEAYGSECKDYELGMCRLEPGALCLPELAVGLRLLSVFLCPLFLGRVGRGIFACQSPLFIAVVPRMSCLLPPLCS